MYKSYVLSYEIECELCLSFPIWGNTALAQVVWRDFNSYLGKALQFTGEGLDLTQRFCVIVCNYYNLLITGNQHIAGQQKGVCLGVYLSW